MKEFIFDLNTKDKHHKKQFNFTSDILSDHGVNVHQLIQDIKEFQVAIPSWALGAGGTRFGRYHFAGEPRNLEEKIHDIGLLHQLTQSAGAISLHIPWDIPQDYNAIKQLADSFGLQFDAVNSNTFQDQENQNYSYKYGSLSHLDSSVRKQAIQHNIEVIEIGQKLGSKSITVWLADGSNFPGQTNFRNALTLTQSSLQEIYASMPTDWKMLIEYKPYEPHFYHTVIQDWGTSFLLATNCGDKAYTLVDLGHHLPNTNIENIVATLLSQKRLGGFHFNDSKYGDDDLTVGSIKPYQLFLIFNELVQTKKNSNSDFQSIAWMIDASHNTKDPLEDLLQSIDAILIAYAQALIVDQNSLLEAQQNYDVVSAQSILQNAYRTDVRSIVNEAKLQSGGAIDPIKVYRNLKIRKNLINLRGMHTKASGL
ncbi:MAG: TIM barrel protein [Saprospiraceae bacterium]